MTNIGPKVDEVFHCPNCLSACVDFSYVVGGDASCSACGWSGKSKELAGAPFQHNFTSPDDMMTELIRSTKVMVAKDVGPVLLDHLIKWGFITRSKDIKKMTRELGMYLSDFVKVYVQTALTTRKKLVSEEGAVGVDGGNDDHGKN